MKTVLLRNIAGIAAFLLSGFVAGAQNKTIDLFNGVNLKGWGFVLDGNSKQPEEVFTVKDGVIHITGAPFGYMYTNDKYENFHLHVEWRWDKGEATNSGIFLYVQDDNKVWPNAVECQLCAGKAGDFVLLGGSDLAEFKVEKGKQRPPFPVVPKMRESSEMKTGEWNNADVTCNKGNITVYINGVLQNKGSKSMHKSGRIALQSEGKDIQFRNVRITTL